LLSLRHLGYTEAGFTRLWFWRGHQENKSINAIVDFAVPNRNRLYYSCPDLLDSDYQLRQLRRLAYGNVVGGQDHVELRRQRRDSLYRMNVGVEISFRTVQPDWSRVEVISCK
jgi:hypothetical protein